jgi:hypothetical protein
LRITLDDPSGQSRLSLKAKTQGENRNHAVRRADERPPASFSP